MSSKAIYPGGAEESPPSPEKIQRGTTKHNIEVVVPNGIRCGEKVRVIVDGTAFLVVVPDDVVTGESFITQVTTSCNSSLQINQEPNFNSSPQQEVMIRERPPQQIAAAWSKDLGNQSIEELLVNQAGLDVIQMFNADPNASAENNNKYSIHALNKSTGNSVDNNKVEGPIIMVAVEENGDSCQHRWCGARRDCRIRLHAGANDESPTLATFHKRFHLQGCCSLDRLLMQGFCCLRPWATIVDEDNSRISSLYNPPFMFESTQEVRDAQGTVIYLITGQCNLFARLSLGSDMLFEIKEPATRKVVGSIVNQFNGWADAEMDIDRFRVTFPMAIPVSHKLALLSAVLLLDLEFFEEGCGVRTKDSEKK
jgi:hypothetical protein